MLKAINNEADRKFFSDLYYDRYKKWYDCAFNIVNDSHTAKDMVNESFLNLIGYIDKLKCMESSERTAYILVTIRNCCRKYYSQKLKQDSYSEDFYSDDISAALPDTFSVEKKVLDKLDIELINEVLKELTTAEQDFVAISVNEKLSDKEIAKKMGMNYNNVRTYRSRLYKKIRKLCEKKVKVKK